MFVTTNVLARKQVFKNPVYAREAVECLYRLQTLHPFFIYGFVIMPDHCHFLLRAMPPYEISRLMASYKTGLVSDLGMHKLWQPRFDLRIPDNSYACLNYIDLNPVRAGLAERAEDYPWSSASNKWDVSQLS